MRRLRQRKDGVKYYAAVDMETDLPPHVERYHRSKGVMLEPEEKGTPEWWLWRWSARRGLPMVGSINTGNSAWGALQLAYKMGCTKAALVGVDANEQERLEGGKPNNLSHLPLLFESAMKFPGFKFINCGHMQSKVPKMSIEDGMKWLMQ